MSGHGEDIAGYSGRRWPQNVDEVEQFIALLQAEGVRSYLEIGCRYGDTVHAVGRALPVGSRIVAIDLPDARDGRENIGRHPGSGRFLERAIADLRANGQDAHVRLGNSTSADVIEWARALGPFDAVLIDGDHSPEGVRADWKHYGPMGRIVALHDIFGESSAARGPRPLFAELRGQFRAVEITRDRTRRGFGVLIKDRAAA